MRLLSRFVSRFRFHIDLRSMFWLLLIIVLLRKPIAELALPIINALWKRPDAQSLASQLAIGAAGSVIATILIV